MVLSNRTARSGLSVGISNACAAPGTTTAMAAARVARRGDWPSGRRVWCFRRVKGGSQMLFAGPNRALDLQEVRRKFWKPGLGARPLLAGGRRVVRRAVSRTTRPPRARSLGQRAEAVDDLEVAVRPPQLA